ncbi:unnamed protein product [Victoria cruziana]
MGYGEEEGEGGATLERTAFRVAEKKYRLYKDPQPKPRKKQQWRHQHTPVDLSQVTDFRSVLDSLSREGVLPPAIHKLPDDSGLSIFTFDDHPGFYFIMDALSMEEQYLLVKESLTQFPQPPNRTNHNAIYGPIYDLFDAYTEGKILVKLCTTSTGATDAGLCLDSVDSNACKWVFVEEGYCTINGSPHKRLPASMLLRKLRWSTLGMQFDWSKRGYDVSLPHGTIPDMLSKISRRLARLAVPNGEFHPEAAIVNYYGPDDTLGGHVDDMEADWTKPIVSISLGCKAVFLLGGNHRDHPPIAMFVRTGDVVLMAGAARKCFHGVPRIFTDEDNADVSALVQQFSSADEFYFKDYIHTSRININVRQVY